MAVQWAVKVKSRLMARRFKQCEGIDFGDTFSPTVSSFCVRLLNVTVYELDLDVCYFDADQVFLQSKLDGNMFLRLPKRCMWYSLSGKIAVEQEYVWIETGFVSMARTPYFVLEDPRLWAVFG